MQPYMKPGVSAAFAVVIVPAFLSTSMRVNGQDDVSEEAKFRRGLEIAPVPVGPGEASGYPQNGNPYLLTPPGGPSGGKKLVDPTNYPGGGRDFGAFPADSNGSCLPTPFDGSRLQVLPWPASKDMSSRDLRASYENLSAIPCISGPPAPDIRHNDCQ